MQTTTQTNVVFNFLTQTQYDTALANSNINSNELYFVTDTAISSSMLPTASTTTLGGVKVDGSTITISNGVISSAGGSGSSGGTKVVVDGSNTSLQAVTNLNPTYTGNTRGNGAVDLQMFRAFNTNVASGQYSVVIGYNNMADGDYSAAMGYYNTASGDYSVAMGDTNTASGDFSVAMGGNNTASGTCSTIAGYSASCNQNYTMAVNYNNSNVSGNMFSGVASYTASSSTNYIYSLQWYSGDVMIVNYHIIDPSNSIYVSSYLTIDYDGTLGGTTSNSHGYFYLSNGVLVYYRYSGNQPFQLGLFYTQLSGVTSSGSGS